MILLANKTDLDTRMISLEEGEALAKKFGISHFETSAKTGSNIQPSIVSMTNKIFEKIKLNPELYTKKQSGTKLDSS